MTLPTSRLLLPALALALALAASPPALAAEETVKAPAPKGSPEAALVLAFEAAKAGSFSAYLEAFHPDETSTETQRASREKYEWPRFLKQHTWYLASTAPLTFVVTKKEEDASTARLYLKDQKNPDRMPVPVRFKKSGETWLVTSSSL